ncbi:MAG: hypothetical protein AB1896_04335 [Thermodesulfobacteriota bacterium]
MMGDERIQERLTSCVETIIKVHDFLNDIHLDPNLVRKFKQLETSLKSIGLGYLSEVDIRRVEEATNRLLEELRFIFTDLEKDYIHLGPLH